MKTKKRDIRDSGIRLKPIEHNILKNYSKFTKRKKKKKKKKSKHKKSIKEVQIKPKIDDIDKLLTEQKTHKKKDIEIIDKELEEEPITKKIDIVKGKPDISEKDPNIKRVKVDNIEEEGNKKGGGIIIG